MYTPNPQSCWSELFMKDLDCGEDSLNSVLECPVYSFISYYGLSVEVKIPMKG